MARIILTVFLPFSVCALKTNGGTTGPEDVLHDIDLIQQCTPFASQGSTVESVVSKFKMLGRRPRVAVILAQQLRNVIPPFHNERMQRLADLLYGSDIFVAVPSEDADLVQYLPRSLMVAFSDWKINLDSFDPRQREQDVGIRNEFQGAFTQLLRTQDAFQMIQQHEANEGWVYDVVVRLRPEAVHSDICVHGLNKGCAAKGAWMLSFAAHTLADQDQFMAIRFDHHFGGRRIVMKSAMDSVQAYLEQTFGIQIQRQMKFKSGAPQTCSMEVLVTAAKGRRMFNGTYPGEDTLHVVNRKNGLPERDMDGMGIRRFGYDYYGYDKVGPGWSFGYQDACKPYPPVENSTYAPIPRSR